MSTRFIVLSTQRSGSTWVIDTLNSHPMVTCYSEVFLQDGSGKPRFGARDLEFFDDYRLSTAALDSQSSLERQLLD
jgi:LPS sulfotransferase NodH